MWVFRLPSNFLRLIAISVQALVNQQLRQNLRQKIEDFKLSVCILYCYDLFQNTVNTSMAAIKGMKENNWGRIINMTSVSVKEPLSYLALSNTIRSAVTSWGKTLSIESGKYNITVNSVLTGFFNTERLNQLNEEKAKKFNIKTTEVFEKMSEMVPLKRIGEPEEFAYLIAFLSSEYSSYINGVNIPIDGGLLKSM